MNFIKKWYTYQKERFPILTYGLYVFSIVIGTFFVSNEICENLYQKLMQNNYQDNLLMYEMTQPAPFSVNWRIIIPMCIVAFLQFLMVRIIDEFKDYEEDCKYRSYRPVPRGLVSLKELKILFFICAILQVIITVCINPMILIYLAAVWAFFALMSKSFFIKKFLSKHILVEVLLDELLMPILVLYLSKFVQYSNSFDFTINFLNIWKFLLMSYIISWIVEIARKVRCKENEEKGVKTYTAVFGIKKASLILFVLETLLVSIQYLILENKNILLILVPYTQVNILNLLFVIKQNRKFAKAVELSANIYILIAYFSLSLLII